MGVIWLSRHDGRILGRDVDGIKLGKELNAQKEAGCK
jgi:hypothetical protein